MSSMLPVCSTTQSHLVRSLSDKIHPEINDFLLLGLGNRRTSLLLLCSFNFVILNDSLQLDSPSTKFFDLRKLANLFDLSRSYYQIFFSYFLSGSLIRINPSLRSKLRTKSHPRTNWSDSSKFLTARELIQDAFLPTAAR